MVVNFRKQICVAAGTLHCLVTVLPRASSEVSRMVALIFNSPRCKIAEQRQSDSPCRPARAFRNGMVLVTSRLGPPSQAQTLGTVTKLRLLKELRIRNVIGRVLRPMPTN